MKQRFNISKVLILLLLVLLIAGCNDDSSKLPDLPKQDIVFPKDSVKFDMANPIVVARLSYEYGLMFRYDKLKEISVPSTFDEIDKAEKQANRAIKLFKEKGIDFYKESHYDFSKMKYTLIYKDKEHAKVKLIGSFVFYIKNKIKKVKKISRIISLVKMDGLYYFYESRTLNLGAALYKRECPPLT